MYTERERERERESTKIRECKQFLCYPKFLFVRNIHCRFH